MDIYDAYKNIDRFSVNDEIKEIMLSDCGPFTYDNISHMRERVEEYSDVDLLVTGIKLFTSGISDNTELLDNILICLLAAKSYVAPYLFVKKFNLDNFSDRLMMEPCFNKHLPLRLNLGVAFIIYDNPSQPYPAETVKSDRGTFDEQFVAAFRFIEQLGIDSLEDIVNKLCSKSDHWRSYVIGALILTKNRVMIPKGTLTDGARPHPMEKIGCRIRGFNEYVYGNHPLQRQAAAIKEHLTDAYMRMVSSYIS